MFSEHMVAGARQRFCNLSSWIVDDQARPQSLALLRRVLSLTDVTLTGLSLMPLTQQLFHRSGFQLLEEQVVLLAPVSSMTKAAQVHTHEDDLDRLLSGDARTVWLDHRTAPVQQLVLETDDGLCHVIAGESRVRHVRINHVHFVSEPGLFLKHLDRVAMTLMRTTHTPLLRIDRRLLPARLPRQLPHVVQRLGVPRLFRPAHANIAATAVTSLYSEMMFLPL